MVVILVGIIAVKQTDWTFTDALRYHFTVIGPAPPGAAGGRTEPSSLAKSYS